MESSSATASSQQEDAPFCVVITSLGSFANRGVEALGQTCFAQIRKHIPNARIVAFVRNPEYNRRRLDDPSIRMLADAFEFLATSLPRRLLGAVLRQRRVPSLVEQMQLIRDADVVIASGGDNFSSDYGSPELSLRPLRYAQSHNVPVVFLAQSIGVFRNPEHRAAFVSVARRADLITVREHISHDYITRELSLDPSRVQLTADPAFLLEPPPVEQVERILAHYRVDKTRPKVAVAVSQGICEFSGLPSESHFVKLCQLIDCLLEDPDRQILLVPHVEDALVCNNDLFLAARILRQFNFNPRLFVTGLDHTASELKGLLATCDLVIAERMHAAIAALSSGVSCVVIGYSVKGSGIMGDLLGADPIREGLVIPIGDFIDNCEVRTLFERAWSRRQHVSERIKGVLPDFRRKAERNYRLVADLLYSRSSTR
jgi:colanic acid/amylovoran biosynthesis protein